MIKQYLDKYYVSDSGVVYNNNTGRELKLDKSTGYSRVKLSFLNEKKTYLVHRMVADVFIDKVDGKDMINHINGDKLDNRVENLEWVTNQENMIHARDVLMIDFNNGTEPKGVACDNGIVYFSIRQTAINEGITTKTVRARINSGRYRLTTVNTDNQLSIRT